MIEKLEKNRVLPFGATEYVKIEENIRETTIRDHEALSIVRSGIVRFLLPFDVYKTPASLFVALNATKKELQKELENTRYKLYGIFSYALGDGEFGKIEDIISGIEYFRTSKPENLSINLSLSFRANSYEKIISILKETDNILKENKIHDPVDIEDAKKRYHDAISDFKKEYKLDSKIDDLSGLIDFYVYLRFISGIPLTDFLRVRKSLDEQLFKKSEKLTVTVTTDVLATSSYGCYIVVEKEKIK